MANLIAQVVNDVTGRQLQVVELDQEMALLFFQLLLLLKRERQRLIQRLVQLLLLQVVLGVDSQRVIGFVQEILQVLKVVKRPATRQFFCQIKWRPDHSSYPLLISNQGVLLLGLSNLASELERVGEKD